MNEGLINSAILLMSVGEEEAAQIMKYLTPKEVQKIGQAMSRLSGVTRDRIEQVLATFHDHADRHTAIGADSDEYIRSVLTRALGDDKAAYLLDQILSGDLDEFTEALSAEERRRALEASAVGA